MNREKLMFREAVAALCTGRGNIRERLTRLDRELFLLPVSNLPLEVKDIYGELVSLATSVKAKRDEGHLQATFSAVHNQKLENIAENILQIYILLSEKL